MNIVSHFPVCVLWHLPLFYLFIPSLLQKNTLEKSKTLHKQMQDPSPEQTIFSTLFTLIINLSRKKANWVIISTQRWKKNLCLDIDNLFTHLDHAKKFVGDLLEVVAGDDATARPLAQVTGAVFS